MDDAAGTSRARAWAVWGAVWLARLTVAAVFVAAALPKIVDLEGFASDIASYQAFPHWSVNLLAAVVPMIELWGAGALALGWKRRGAALMLGGLTVGFIALVSSVIVRGIDLQCGCFGQDAQASAVGWPLLLRDVALLGAIAIAAIEVPRPPRPLGLTPGS